LNSAAQRLSGYLGIQFVSVTKLLHPITETGWCLMKIIQNTRMHCGQNGKFLNIEYMIHIVASLLWRVETSMLRIAQFLLSSKFDLFAAPENNFPASATSQDC